MQLTLSDRKFFECTAEKKADCFPTIKALTDFATTARTKGLLALEDPVNKCEDPFLKYAILLVVDANDPDKVDELLSQHFVLSSATGADALRMFMIIRGARSISCGTNPRLIEEMLLFMLADDDLSKQYCDWKQSMQSVPEQPNGITHADIEAAIKGAENNG